MKVIALKDFTDKRVSLYEGEIRNIGGTLATQLITKGVCSTAFPDDVIVTPSSTSGTELADIKINGQSNKIYAPAGGGEARILEADTTGEVLTLSTGLVATDFIGAWIHITIIDEETVLLDSYNHVTTVINVPNSSLMVVLVSSEGLQIYDYNSATGELTVHGG